MQGRGSGVAGLLTNIVNIFIIAVPLSYLFVFILGYGYLWVGLSRVIGSAGAAVVGSKFAIVQISLPVVVSTLI